MRNNEPSRRWIKQFDAEFIAAGGHEGPWTLMTARTYAADLYKLGATPKVAGRAAYDTYQKLARRRDTCFNNN